MYLKHDQITKKKPEEDSKNLSTLKKAQLIRITDLENGYAKTESGWIPVISLEKEQSEFQLTVNTDPKDATVRIIKPAIEFQNGMWLKNGEYTIEVSKNGYGVIKNINPTSNTTLNIVLSETDIFANGSIFWGTGEVNFSEAYPFEIINKIIVEKHTEQMTWNAANNYCSNLEININGLILKSFRLPTVEELSNEAFLLPILKKKGRFGMWSSTPGQPVEYSYGSDEAKKTYRGGHPNNWYNSNKEVCQCVANENELNKIPISEIAKNIFLQKNVSVSKFKLPDKPERPKYPELLKKEFETTEEFNARETNEKRQIDDKYVLELSRWKKEYESILQGQKKDIAEFHKKKEAHYLEAMEKALHVKYGKPSLKSIQYDADNQVFSMNIQSERGGFNETLKAPVRTKYAQLFKELVTSPTFQIAFEFNVTNNTPRLKGIRHIANPEAFVIESEYNKAVKADEVDAYQYFISQYPESGYIEQAKTRMENKISQLENMAKINAERAEKARIAAAAAAEKQRLANIENQKRIDAEEAAERKIYNRKKKTGDKICMIQKITSGIFFRETNTYTVVGYVERVDKDRIQIRISTVPSYINITHDGVELREGKLIWDDYWNWKACY